MSTELPVSARFALWFSGWAAGHVSLDEARDGIVADEVHHVLGLPGRGEPVPLIVALGHLRAEGAHQAVLALPEPGDPLGLAGPSGFNTEVLAAGEGVLLDGADLGLVPHRAGAGVQWQCLDAVTQAQVPDVFEAERALRQVVIESASRLAALDVARWRPEVADELTDLRGELALDLPPGMTPRTTQLVSLATRCRHIVDLALADDGGAVSAAEAEVRRQALLPLGHAARRGLVASCAYPWAP